MMQATTAPANTRGPPGSWPEVRWAPAKMKASAERKSRNVFMVSPWFETIIHCFARAGGAKSVSGTLKQRGCFRPDTGLAKPVPKPGSMNFHVTIPRQIVAASTEFMTGNSTQIACPIFLNVHLQERVHLKIPRKIES